MYSATEDFRCGAMSKGESPFPDLAIVGSLTTAMGVSAIAAAAAAERTPRTRLCWRRKSRIDAIAFISAFA